MLIVKVLSIYNVSLWKIWHLQQSYHWVMIQLLWGGREPHFTLRQPRNPSGAQKPLTLINSCVVAFLCLSQSSACALFVYIGKTLLLNSIAPLGAVLYYFFYTGHLYSQNFRFYLNVLSPGDSFVTLTLSFLPELLSTHCESFGCRYQCNSTAGGKLLLANLKLLNHFYHPSLYSLTAAAVSASVDGNPGVRKISTWLLADCNRWRSSWAACGARCTASVPP